MKAKFCKELLILSLDTVEVFQEALHSNLFMLVKVHKLCMDVQSLASGQRSSSHGYAPETSSSSTTSHPLYGQGYQNYGAGGQSFNQYQPSSHQQAYQNYNAYQVLLVDIWIPSWAFTGMPELEEVTKSWQKSYRLTRGNIIKLHIEILSKYGKQT